MNNAATIDECQRPVFPVERLVGRVLHLTLKKKWFDQIASGVKREEYREIKPYWTKRLCQGQHYTHVQFRNGYRPDSPTMLAELESVHAGHGIPAFGAPPERVYVLRLGKVRMTANAVAQPRICRSEAKANTSAAAHG